MAKIRSDLVGAIYAGGHVLTAGDQVPSGVTLSPAHLAAAKPAKKAPAKRGKKIGEVEIKVEPSEDAKAAAEESAGDGD